MSPSRRNAMSTHGHRGFVGRLRDLVNGIFAV
jgi:hypothetical protein